MSMLMVILIAFVFFTYAIVFMVFIITWMKILRKPVINNTDVFISVVVAVRNEASNIGNLLNCMKTQSYAKSNFEIIIVDDHSEDDTVQLINNFKLDNRELNIIIKSLSETSSKKSAISTGVLASRGELIVTTDADCSMSASWLETMGNFYDRERTEMIIAPVSLNAQDVFIEKFQQMDYMAMQVSGMASMRLGQPLLCSGANLAFNKKAFMEVSGYEGNEKVASGDDVFLMFKINNKYPSGIQILASPKVIVTSPAITSLKKFIQQRNRWGSKLKHYKSGYVFFIAAIIASVNLILLFSFLASIIFNEYWMVFIVSLLFKSGVDYLFLNKSARFFSIKISLKNFILAECFYPVYFLLIGLAFFGSNEWKGRKTDS